MPGAEGVRNSMNVKNKLQKRGAILIGAACLTMVAAAPLISNAQDASPSASPAGQSELVANGEKIFSSVCIACHQPGGVGIPGIYPALDKNPLLTTEDPTYMITTVLNGRGGMPTFRGIYSDEEIASVVTYVRQAWDNKAPAVTAEEVAKIRQQTSGPSGTPAATPNGQRPEGNSSGTQSNPATATPDVGTPKP